MSTKIAMKLMQEMMRGAKSKNLFTSIISEDKNIVQQIFQNPKTKDIVTKRFDLESGEVFIKGYKAKYCGNLLEGATPNNFLSECYDLNLAQTPDKWVSKDLQNGILKSCKEMITTTYEKLCGQWVKMKTEGELFSPTSYTAKSGTHVYS